MRKFNPTRGVIRFGLDGICHWSYKPLPIFKGHFGRKYVPIFKNILWNIGQFFTIFFGGGCYVNTLRQTPENFAWDKKTYPYFGILFLFLFLFCFGLVFFFFWFTFFLFFFFFFLSFFCFCFLFCRKLGPCLGTTNQSEIFSIKNLLLVCHCAWQRKSAFLSWY